MPPRRAPDVVLTVDDDGARLALDEPTSRPTASADASTRLLALWGRHRPAAPIAWTHDAAEAERLARFLWSPAPAPTVAPSALSETR